jgi:Skp family chaperone for outer membrane proteins
MRNVLRLVVVVGLMVIALPATAGKIGFVDAERAVAQVKEGKAQLEALEQWAAPRRTEVQGLADKVAELRRQIAQQRGVATEESLERLNQQELEARRAFEDGRRDFERELNTKQEEFLGDVAVKVGKVASDYGKANDFDAIFVLNAQPLIYVAEGADLTDTVIRLYDERFPVSN